MKTVTGERAIEGSDIFVAAGRVPNTRDIGLEAAGVELDATSSDTPPGMNPELYEYRGPH